MEAAKVISQPQGEIQPRIFVPKNGYMTPDEIVQKFYSTQFACRLNTFKVSQHIADNPLVQEALVKLEIAKYRAQQKARWDRNKKIARKFVNKH